MDINEYIKSFGLQVATDVKGESFDERFHAGIGDYCNGTYGGRHDNLRKRGYEAARAAAEVIIRLRQSAFLEEGQQKLF